MKRRTFIAVAVAATAVQVAAAIINWPNALGIAAAIATAIALVVLAWLLYTPRKVDEPPLVEEDET